MSRIGKNSAYSRIINNIGESKKEVEHRNLPHVDGKVSTVGIGAGGLHETTSQEIKGISSVLT
ncbi:hypothetical protein FXW07_10320 [Methanosarcina sp. DH1]|uniref:hypothetical protein n=1 Tax=Methanosarcina sp. DH1 TaxID=2605695 RepID=UPI001E2E813D|nr:hypothetical protein [Methanosarcina sp. DH1]MCC4766999.1 hypothetical protein [Methanosarcina sp. DH1]